MRTTVLIALAAPAVLVSGCDSKSPRDAALESQIADLQRQVSEVRSKVEDLDKFLGPRKWYQAASLPDALRSLQGRIDDMHREIEAVRRQK
jgi:outer membrane murein-binding lipoprotein Lpp